MVHHYRRLILGVVLGLLLLVPSTGVLADAPEVDITVSAWVIGIPGGFIVIYVNDQQVDIEWTTSPGALNTMVRAAIGRPPEDRTSGYLVYYGTDESCSDTGVSLDETAAPVYYRAWSETAEGAWSPLYAEGEMEGVGMVLIALIILALGFTAFCYIFRKGAMAFAAAGGWMVMAVYALGKSDSPNPTQITDIYMALFWLGISLVIVSVMEPLIMKAPGKELQDEETLSEMGGIEKDYDEIRKEMDVGSMFRRRRKPKQSKFSRTGKE